MPDTQFTRWIAQMRMLQGMQGALPETLIKRNIKEHSIPATGRGATRKITITPYNLHLFFEEDALPHVAQQKFGMDQWPPEEQQEEDSGLEHLVFTAQRRSKRISGALTIEDIDVDKGTYLTPKQMSMVLPNYDPDTFIAIAQEAGIGPTTIKGKGRTHWYLLDTEAMDKLPRRDLTEDEQSREIYTAGRRQRIVNTMDREHLPLDEGVWLLKSQAAALFENYTAHYFRGQAANLGIHHEKIFGVDRYFLKTEDLDQFPKKHLTDQDIKMIRRLGNVVHHQAIATAFDCSKLYIGILASGREKEGRTRERRIHSDERLASAIECYHDFSSGPARELIYTNVFFPLAGFMGKASVAEPYAFITPFLQLHIKVNGITNMMHNKMATTLKHCVMAQTLASMMDYAHETGELPRAVIDEIELPAMGQTWTITNHFYLGAKKELRMYFEKELNQSIQRLAEVLSTLGEFEQLYLVERFGLGVPATQVDWVPLSQRVMGEVFNMQPKEVSNREQELLGKLRLAKMQEYFRGFSYGLDKALSQAQQSYTVREAPKGML